MTSDRTTMRIIHAFLAMVCASFVTSTAFAGGYDTPMLYSARHMGMGGAAVSYVSDPSALFHNPAGLANIKKLSVIGDLSLALGKIKASPAATVAEDVESEPTIAPFFLVGAGYRLNDWITLGFAIFPIASSGGEYKYNVGPVAFEDRTKLVFIEATPGLSVNLPAGFSIGAGYRVTSVSLERFQGQKGSGATDFEMSGLNFLGFRAGAQWQREGLRLGINYRSKTVTEIEGDKGTAFGWKFRDISSKFTLPSRLVFGARYDFDAYALPLSVSVDAEYGFNSENKRSSLKGTCVDPNDAGCSTIQMNGAPQVFKWDNAWTLRPGLEYRLMEGKLPLRVGYIWDQQTSNQVYPTAFGTPPGAGHIATVGCGYNLDRWQFNAAYAYRTVKGDVTAADVAARTEPCPFCGAKSADGYSLTMHGLYLDTSYSF